MNRKVGLVGVAVTVALTAACGTTSPMWKTNAVKLDVDAFFLNPNEENPQQMQAEGTGVFLDPAGTLVTNNHVMRRCQRVIARFEDGRNTVVDEIVAVSPEVDVAVMRAQGVPDLQKIVLASRKDVKKGDEVLAVGNVLGLGLSVMPAHVENIAEINGREFIIISADLGAGASGGPVFDQQERLVGLVRGTMTVGNTRLSLVIPAWEVSSVVEHGMKVDGECEGCRDCYSSSALRRRLKVLVHRRVKVDPGKGTRFYLALEQGRDYSVSVRVKEGAICLPETPEYSPCLAAGKEKRIFFTSPLTTLGVQTFFNHHEQPAVFEFWWSRVEW